MNKNFLLTMLGVLLVSGSASADVGASGCEVSSKAYFELLTGISMVHGSARGFVPNMKSPSAIGNSKITQDFGSIIGGGWSGVGYTVLGNFGYDWRLPNSCFIMGAFAGGGWTGTGVNCPYNTTISSDSGDDVPATVVTEGTAMRLKTKGFINAALRFGFVMGRNTAAFLNVGWSLFFSRLTPRYGSVYMNSGSTPLDLQKVKGASGAANGALVGVSLEHNLSKNFILGFTFNIAGLGARKKFTFPNMNVTANSKQAVKFSTRQHMLMSMITMKYAMPVR